MDFKQLLQTHYFQEFERRRELNGNLSIVVGLLTIIAAGLASMMKNLRPPLNSIEVFLAIGLALTGLAIVIAIYFAIRAFVGHAYRYVAPMSQLQSWRENALASGSSVQHLDTATVDAICQQYIESIATNDAANDRKSGYVHRTSQAAVVALALAMITAVPWVMIEVYSVADEQASRENADGKR